MTFASPIALILLLVLPLIWYIGWPRYAFRRRRDVLSLILRTAIIVLVVLALAGLQVVRTVERQAVVFLLDVSDSVGRSTQAAQLDYIREAVQGKPTDDQWALIVFGADNRPEVGFTPLTDVPELQSTVLRGNTDIAAAIQTAIAIFPADATRRIVLLSDGQQTLGDALTKARLAAASGIKIDYVPFFREAVPDARVVRVDAPSRVAEGQQFDINISVEAEAETAATLLVFSNGGLVSEDEIRLQAGTNGYTLTQTSSESGFLSFEARLVIATDADSFSQNNALASFSEVVGPPRVLLVASEPNEIASLLPALTGAGVDVDVTTPANLPADTSGLAAYKALVMANVPATDLSTRQMQRIDSYVQDLGGGLVFIGGPDSYGPGRYYDTPLAATLPVEMQIRDQQRLPQLTIAYLIDRSGSMGQTDASGIPNIDLAKRAINISLDLLQPTDRAGIGTFDTGGAWVAEIQAVNNAQQLQRRVATLRAGGGTDIGAGISLVERDLISDPSQRKHLILLTDGGASSRDLVERAAALNENHEITLSVVAIGGNTPRFLQEMVEVGEGNYHVVQDVSQIPRIFALETVLAARTFIEEGQFSPRLTAVSPIMNGIDALPPLAGYVATTEKDTAQVILRGPEPFSDPVLATWQYGLGRALAFTSDATSRWGRDWTTWPDFPRFWQQAISWSITQSAANNIETRITMQGDQARIVVDAIDEDGAFLNNLALQASVIDPENNSRDVTLRQVAPGRYEGSFTPQAEGAYFLAVNGGGALPNGQSLQFNEVNGWVMAYSPEYAQTEPDETLLARLASITGGESLAGQPAAVFMPPDDLRTAASPVWPVLLLLAMLLLPVDIAVRRLIITRSDLQRLRSYLLTGRTQNELQVERLGMLRQARERARQRSATSSSPASTIGNLRRNRDERRDDAPEPDQPDAPAPQRPRPTAQTPASPRSVTGDDSTVGNLLKRRRGDSSADDAKS